MQRNTRPAWTAPADDWSRETAERMHREGCSAGSIIQHLEAYGCGFFAAQAIVRNLSTTSDPERTPA